ncbi:MAG: mechanosensitive ion channel family protein [Anaerolineae bacterium]|nr:mechanosensitive ion channel family protein [Anaerolineae bacterium]
MDSLESNLLAGVVIVAVAIAGLVAAQILRRRILRAVRSQDGLEQERQQQVITMIEIAVWGVTVVIVSVAVLMLLSRFDIDIVPMLASAGVVGLAVGLGAQSLIKDLLGGFFILVENQYAVGDTIKVGALSGQVERLTLRATSLRDIDGYLHIIPNGEARIVSNMTKAWSRAVVEVGVAYEEDLDRVFGVLEEAAEAFARDPAWELHLLEAPQVLGPISLGDWAVGVRVMVKTRPGQQLEVARELRKRVLITCGREGITLPYPRQEVWVRDWQESRPGQEQR